MATWTLGCCWVLRQSPRKPPAPRQPHTSQRSGFIYGPFGFMTLLYAGRCTSAPAALCCRTETRVMWGLQVHEQLFCPKNPNHNKMFKSHWILFLQFHSRNWVDSMWMYMPCVVICALKFKWSFCSLLVRRWKEEYQRQELRKGLSLQGTQTSTTIRSLSSFHTDSNSFSSYLVILLCLLSQ